MFKALFRFILFTAPAAYIDALSWILFDGEEVRSVLYQTKPRKTKDKVKNAVRSAIERYLRKCYEQVHKDGQ